MTTKQINFTTSLATELNFLQTLFPSTYENVRHLLDTTYKMQVTTLAEQEFRNEQIEHFKCFDFNNAEELAFRQRYNIYTKAKPYIYKCKNSDYCAIYCVDNIGTIRHTINLYDTHQIKELLWVFGLNMHECRPMWHVMGGEVS